MGAFAIFSAVYFFIIFLKFTFFTGGSCTIVEVTSLAFNLRSIIIFLNGFLYFSLLELLVTRGAIKESAPTVGYIDYLV